MGRSLSLSGDEFGGRSYGPLLYVRSQQVPDQTVGNSTSLNPPMKFDTNIEI